MDKRYKTDTKTWAKGKRVTTFAIAKFEDYRAISELG